MFLCSLVFFQLLTLSPFLTFYCHGTKYDSHVNNSWIDNQLCSLVFWVHIDSLMPNVSPHILVTSNLNWNQFPFKMGPFPSPKDLSSQILGTSPECILLPHCPLSWSLKPVNLTQKHFSSRSTVLPGSHYLFSDDSGFLSLLTATTLPHWVQWCKILAR